MISILIAGAIAMVFSFALTPVYIRLLVRREYGQFVRDDGPTSHSVKRGTPTMGGVMIILATMLGYAGGHVAGWSWPTASGLLAIFLMVGLGLLGFADDYSKIAKKQSLGLSPKAKLIGQGLIGTVFAVLALQFPDINGNTPASTQISFVRDLPWLDLAFAGTVVGIILFALWSNFLVAAWSNGVNLTDGLDGLASGATILFAASYVLVTFWQWRQECGISLEASCYSTRDPLDLAIFGSAVIGACVGFLWWNTSPAKIFMGDTGSLALGGALAALTILSRTQILGGIIGGLFVIISLSVIIQVTSFKLTKKRVFRMAPLQHHFELKGWNEVTIVVRFWIIAGIFAAIGLGLFYADALTTM
ncbi:MAG: phospho-N-acetylmuramoyl-pentapeptide-transferase [Dermabacter sp.]|nr:phospho-N-acetylmuramoyl-pentapeptide-transferase [Dermabacter sp.]